MQYEIREAIPSDIPDVIGLLRDLAKHEMLEGQFFVDEQKLGRALFGSAAFTKCLVGLSERRTAAYAIFFPKFSSFRGEAGIYLEDLYVSSALRGKGLGLQMLKAVAKYAQDNGFERLDWQAIRTNYSAIGFYKKLGAESMDGNINFRLIGESFEKLAK